MTEPANGAHPEPADLQAFADGEAGSERVADHVESCAVCRADVAAIRRVTAALSLGSKSPDTLMERIRERKAGSAQRVVPIASRRERTSARRFMLPLGLAAAAALAIIVPRAIREPVGDETPIVPGAKGAAPADIIVEQRIVTESGPTSIDIISWDIRHTGLLRAELRYRTGVPESERAERLASRVAQQLRQSGIRESSITVIPVTTRASLESLPPGAVEVTLRWLPSGAAP